MASIRKIEGKKGISYKIEVSNGYDVNGKKIRESTTFVPDPTMTKKQQEKAVQKFAAEFEEKVKNGNRIEGDKITLLQFTEEMDENLCRKSVGKDNCMAVSVCARHLHSARIGTHEIGKNPSL